jgi:biotin operon repressor
VNQLNFGLDDPKTAVLVVLQAHQGRGRGIKAKDLARTAGVTEREVRHQVSALREDGVAVCGHPTEGYYIAASAEELEATCEYLRTRAMHSLRIEARLRRISLPDLLGQLHLKT